MICIDSIQNRYSENRIPMPVFLSISMEYHHVSMVLPWSNSKQWSFWDHWTTLRLQMDRYKVAICWFLSPVNIDEVNLKHGYKLILTSLTWYFHIFSNGNIY